MSSFMSTFIILIAVLASVAVVVALLGVAQLRTYRERRARKRKAEAATQVKMQLADMRNSRQPLQKRVGQGNDDVENTGQEAGQRANAATGEPASQAQGTVGQGADQTRATEAEPWTTFNLGSAYDRQGEYARAVQAYQQAIDSEHAEWKPKAAFDLGILFEERGEHDRAVDAYQQVIASGDPEEAPRAAFDLGCSLRMGESTLVQSKPTNKRSTLRTGKLPLKQG
jgi:tetratricopeptide (TPR) repeat protein